MNHLANIPIQPVPAPAEHVRVTADSLKNVSTLRQAQYDAARLAIIKTTKRERGAMIDWLYDKGIRIDPAGKYDDYQLQQLMLYWHFCDDQVRQIIAESKPVFYLSTPQPKDNLTKEDLESEIERLTHVDLNASNFWKKGGLNTALLDDGTIGNVTTCSGKRFFKLTKETDVSSQAILANDKMNLSSGQYDAGYATIYHRRELADLLAGESEGLPNLYGLFFFAHEMTHGLQNLFAPVYNLEQAMVDARTRLMLLANKDVNLYRRVDKTVPASNPNDGKIPSDRPLRGARPLIHPEEDDRVYEYLGNATLTLPPNSRLALTPGTTTLRPATFVKNMYIAFMKVINSLTTNSVVHAPSASLEFAADFKALGEYLSTHINGAPDTPLPPFKAVPLAVYPINGLSLLDTLLLTIDTNVTEGRFPAPIAIQYKAQLNAIQIEGFKTIRNAIPLWIVKTDRAATMQRQQTALFPDLLGRYTDYANLSWNNGQTEARNTLGPIFLKAAVFDAPSVSDPARDIWNLLPNSIQEIIRNHSQLRNIKSKDDLRTKITPLEWYKLGAPLGCFNVYCQEWDAEAYAMWSCCPEEFVEMYTRAVSLMGGSKVPSMEQILNQATYAKVRGIGEVGDAVPRYRD